ncbi:transcription factor DIVARICATA-like [Impatiens glandulifera]|uniref:transcription factor DIVARICATA-like n=1 Tax=Impatiens glandulifera TaxID=253017 RepID=UPI001FB0FE05|nr:transcription factor DIVARICATA-like [Impatiens glandulifera]
MSAEHHNHGRLTSSWNKEENKAFEQALAKYSEDRGDSAGRWANIAAKIPGRSMVEIKRHYDILIDDVRRIEAGFIPPPNYELSINEEEDNEPRPKHDRRKSTPWTENEHKLFLLGLQMYGKGDWRSIARKSVVTRTAAQVASHAQKYFARQNAIVAEKKRSSIHDMTINSITPLEEQHNLDPSTSHSVGMPIELPPFPSQIWWDASIQ